MRDWRKIGKNCLIVFKTSFLKHFLPIPTNLSNSIDLIVNWLCVGFEQKCVLFSSRRRDLYLEPYSFLADLLKYNFIRQLTNVWSWIQILIELQLTPNQAPTKKFQITCQWSWSIAGVSHCSTNLQPFLISVKKCY